MDSLTQIVLGASIGGAMAPAGQRRKGLLVGAVLGTLPDLDVFIDYGDAVSNFTYHRGFSHSLFVLVPFSLLLWLLLRRTWKPVGRHPWHWLGIIVGVLVTHPLLDAHTAYGTQLWWPLEPPPAMWSTLYIIDPAYTLPLLIGALVATIWPRRRIATQSLNAGLLLSTLYLAWSWVAKDIAESEARASLAELGLAEAPLYSTPTPLNTMLWRFVVLTDDGYLEGFDSLLLTESTVEFTAYPSDVKALREAGDIRAVQRLQWFSHGFLGASVQQGRLQLADLRMGQEPVYAFVHVVAQQGNPHWHAIEPYALPWSISDRSLLQTWDRIWSQHPPSIETEGQIYELD